MRIVFPVAVMAALTACEPKHADPAVERGRAAYMGACMQCHNMNPALDGALGPAIHGAPKALLEAKIVNGDYPPGYTPKRTTKIMPRQPQLAASIDDLAAFLNAN